MTWPKQNNPSSNRRKAKAPYNFVPLPEQVSWAPEDPPAMDRYYPDRYTGWLDCTLTTSSPLYVRCGLTLEEAKGGTEAKDRPDFFYVDSESREPIIPGSSLRGMLRTLVEIVSYSKIQPVTSEGKVFFRAVAAAHDDPLRDPYRNVLGKYGRYVKAGYVKREGNHWYVEPAFKPANFGFRSEEKWYLKVKDHQVSREDLPGFIPLRSPKYHLQYHQVAFDVEERQGQHGPYVWVTNVGAPGAGGKQTGVLVGSGNMAETSDQAAETMRKTYAIVLPRNPEASPVPIDEQAARDYMDSLTDFQKEKPFDGRYGCLIEGRPIFYVEEDDKVVTFGHSPNFRVPAWLVRSKPKRAATPLDFVPDRLHNAEQTDLAEALFGYVDEDAEERPVNLAGRVCVTDATLKPNQEQVWLSDEAIVPQVLASPKPTTFQHYLVQTATGKKQLRHYNSPTPDETVIRGHKLYWHKGEVSRKDFEESNPLKPGDTQHTEMRPVRSGVEFRFEIHFENLSPEELGAMLWILDLAQDDDYRLKLGMGKPLGLGAVKIESELHLTDRQGEKGRYAQLFDGDKWAQGLRGDDETKKGARKAIKAFESWILPEDKESLEELERIRMLLALLSWPGPSPEETRYLEIEHPQYGNEYRDRPVLPDPLSVTSIAPGPTTQPPRDERKKPPSDRKTGRVKWFNEGKGYGFIDVDGESRDIFVHYSAIEGSGLRALYENQRVEFSVVEAQKGPRAENVRIIE